MAYGANAAFAAAANGTIRYFCFVYLPYATMRLFNNITVVHTNRPGPRTMRWCARTRV
jgi:hypothetical protein